MTPDALYLALAFALLALAAIAVVVVETRRHLTAKRLERDLYDYLNPVEYR
ncbi:hypothetical protein O4273_26540 [Rhodococcus ruber]|uniref:hypothetical protein n=1 Tax=Rhodococcus ruber TaxID=1830 RepID=UPI0022B2B58A|nr:hypothetical protein [Rhodococcus ruber]MCZ4506388.1 hypothetical protein [Rhodococcus ruber]